MDPAAPSQRPDPGLLARLRRAAVWARPRAAAALRGLWTALRGAARLASEHRGALFSVGQRAMWWGALLLLVVGGQVILGGGALPSRMEVLGPFAIGVALCATVRLVAPARQLRMAALGLGTLHCIAAVIVWTAFAA